MRFSRILFSFSAFCFLVLVQFACRKNDKVDTSPGLKLTFSTDTVFFDTVFPSIGSVTQRLIVHNLNKNKVSISSITIAGGQNSCYRLNVSGSTVTPATNVEIPGGDSLFIFVRVTIDPSNLDIPFVVSDSIQFVTNGSRQQVKLVAWGRNAIFHRNEILKSSATWDSLKAHVIYGSLIVGGSKAGAATLTIMPGTRIYFHKGSWMEITAGSTLKIPATLEHPVRFQGDRMDEFYKDLPGQWEGIYLDAGSRDHDVNYAIIKNGVFGLSADSLGSQGLPLLTLSNSIIRNMTTAGLYAYASSVTSVNCVFGDCGGSCVYVDNGGTYDFRQMTISNNWYSTVRRVASVYLSNYTYDTLGNQKTNPLTKGYFGNAIIYGSNDDEITLDSVAAVPFNCTFDHDLMKSHLTGHASRFINCIFNKDPRFVNVAKQDYRIDSLSPAINQGALLGIPYDILGVSRDAQPDPGAYEYVKKN